MKITNYTLTNGLKVYTLEHNNKPIAQSTNINLVIKAKENILFSSYNKRENYKTK
jgi:predicted Zn-dependent peptidase